MVIFNPISLNADLNISTNDCVNTINKMLAEGDFARTFFAVYASKIDFPEPANPLIQTFLRFMSTFFYYPSHNRSYLIIC